MGKYDLIKEATRAHLRWNLNQLLKALSLVPSYQLAAIERRISNYTMLLKDNS